MAETVFILGAGASAHAGAPVMANFLQKAREIDRVHFNGNSEAYSRVDRAQRAAQMMTSKVHLDVNNIEVLFNALEVGRMIGQFPNHEGSDIEAAIDSIKVMIAQTLDYSIGYPQQDPKGLSGSEWYGICGSDDYMIFASLLKFLVDNRRGGLPPAVITFNYDIALEVALHTVGVPIDYCLAPTENSQVTPLLKLHGSVNWWKCMNESCDGVHHWPINRLLAFPPVNIKNAVHHITPFARKDQCNVVCPKSSKSIAASGTPFIVPPTWNKTTNSSEITPVWVRAARELSDARHVIIIGYSFPKTDEYFRMLFSLGLADSPVLETVRVIDIGDRSRIDSTYRSLLSKQSESVYSHMQRGFASGILNSLDRVIPSHLSTQSFADIADILHTSNRNIRITQIRDDTLTH